MAKHKLDGLFSEGLENFESTPAPSAWDQIESELNHKRSKSVWAWAGIAASAAVLLASSWFMLQETPVEEEGFAYEYSESAINNLTQPAKVVYVPIYIHTVIEKPSENIARQVKSPTVKPTEQLTTDNTVLVAQEEIKGEQPEIITLEDVPLVTDEEMLMASTEIAVDEESALSADGPATTEAETVALQPVTIIYKQGEPAKESNFARAIDYMEDVRLGEKKLVNFEKLKENFRSKFRSGEDTD